MVYVFVRFSREGKTARSTSIVTGKTTRKDSATWTANSGSVGEASNNTLMKTIDIKPHIFINTIIMYMRMRTRICIRMRMRVSVCVCLAK